ncbi:MAG TPA: hypothetical protein PLB92_06150 [Rhodoglobus sp.]|nr:hypothetical protein [Rhodoglobus sp.]
MATKRQLRADLAEALTTTQALTATVAAVTAGRDLLEAEARDLQAKLFEAGCQLVAAGQEIAERDALLAERGEALRTALEWGAGRDDDRAKIAELRSDLELSIARTEHWRAEARGISDAVGDILTTVTLMSVVGDRMASKVDAQTAKEWAAAKDGRALRGPDGRWLKADA